jgi:predicted nucleic acid-binding protein
VKISKSYVLDANAILRFFEGRPGAERIEQLLNDARRHGHLLSMSVANLGEVFYHVWQDRGEESARRTMANLSRLPIQVLPVDLEQSLKAGEIKALHKVPYVDCIAAALAEIRGATLVTADRDFEKLGRRIPILWLSHA